MELVPSPADIIVALWKSGLHIIGNFTLYMYPFPWIILTNKHFLPF